MSPPPLFFLPQSYQYNCIICTVLLLDDLVKIEVYELCRAYLSFSHEFLKYFITISLLFIYLFFNVSTLFLRAANLLFQLTGNSF